MALPLNISELIHGKIVEWERLEFKAGWNPEEILHSVCAFANDINNWGGGYIIVGIAEKDGIPKLPPKGIPLSRFDYIQGELVNICYQIQPNYLPVTQPFQISDKHILVIWCPAGDMRPYSGPSTQGKDARRQYYIRSGSRSIVANGNNLTRLIELTAKVPFDDRINQQAQLNDLDLGIIREFLQEVKSDLFAESAPMPFPVLCKAMHIARGPIEALRPVNAGLLFFNKSPHLFFDRAWIELAIHKDDSGRNYIAETFTGPLHKQVRDCLSYLKNMVILSKTVKINGQAESITISNYPYNAIEEAISNAVYHKSYAEGKPIEVQVLPDRIEILSYPGPLPPTTNADLQQRRVIARDYRNRRIGDFLKELKLTEGKATGFPLMKDEMAKNGNPEPLFFTDEEKTLFLVTLPCHSDWLLSKPVSKSVSKLTREDIDLFMSEKFDFQLLSRLLDNDFSDVRDYVRDQIVTKSLTKSLTKIIDLIDFLTIEKTREELLGFLEIGNQTINFNANIKPLLEYEIIELTVPDKPKSRNQKYRLTEKGRKLLK
ncbi:MAG: putative DNA binding domain-containing protein [Bacteroidales bacterium]|nr:putative DNA binding domain-containing protein [Bacteroidales bacterium]MDP3003842.1 putative DNA binding domain-containing protein [Bacteroidales bacterium]